MTDKPIQSLTFTEFVRLRPAMYIGSIKPQGIKQLLEYVFEELINCSKAAPIFDLSFFPGNRVLLKLKNIGTKNFVTNLIPLITPNHRDTFGIRVLIALSDTISVTAGEERALQILSGEKGNYDMMISGLQDSLDTVTIDCMLDPTIFKDFLIMYNDIIPFLQQFAYLNPELKIIVNDHIGEELQRNVFHYPKGICTQLDDMIQQGYHPYVRGRIDMLVEKNEYQYRIALCNNVWMPRDLMKTFAGNIEMIYGGSLEKGIVQGISSFLKTIANKEGIKIRATKKEVQRHFAFIAVVKGKDVVFEGCTRTKLGVKVIQQDVCKLVFKYLMAGHESGNEDIKGLADRFISFEGIKEEQEDQEEDY